jgi:uncharacterized protein
VDDLNTPLGQKPDRRNARWKPLLLPAVTVVLGVLVVGALAWIAFVDDPLGGEPIATIEIQQAKTDTAEPAADKGATKSDPAAGEQTVTIIDGKSGARTEVAVRSGDPADQPVATGASSGLLEDSPHGPIPRIAADGARPLDVYSRAGTDDGRKGPRIAIVVGGLGIGTSVTEDSIAKLPGTVTLAFAPHGANLQRWSAKARGAGHEILLQIPMKPFDYPDNDPGPQALLTNLPQAENLDRLHWVLSRMQGYVGVVNFMGARFTSSQTALAPILADVAERGLLYFDNGTSSRSIAQKVALTTKAPFVKADVVIDAKPHWSDIDAALEQLERIAAYRGFAVGVTNALPVSIERIARWVKAAEARGVRVVFLSAVAARARQS